MSERILVTGSTDGIGLETALTLARRGHQVILHGRNAKKLEAATAELKKVSATAALTPELGDLGSLADVRRLAASILKRTDGPTVLLNNAGVFMDGAGTTVAATNAM